MMDFRSGSQALEGGISVRRGVGRYVSWECARGYAGSRILGVQTCVSRMCDLQNGMVIHLGITGGGHD